MPDDTQLAAFAAACTNCLSERAQIHELRAAQAAAPLCYRLGQLHHLGSAHSTPHWQQQQAPATAHLPGSVNVTGGQALFNSC